MSRDQPIHKNSRLAKFGVLMFVALWSAMVVFAGTVKSVEVAFLKEPPTGLQASPGLIPALLVAGVLAYLGWRSPRWQRFALWQAIAFAILFGVLLLIFGPD